MNPLEKHGNRLAVAAAGIQGGILCFFRYGAGFLNFGRVDLLLGQADTAFYHLAWTFFRNDAWHWPPGLLIFVRLADLPPLAAEWFLLWRGLNEQGRYREKIYHR